MIKLINLINEWKIGVGIPKGWEDYTEDEDQFSQAYPFVEVGNYLQILTPGKAFDINSWANSVSIYRIKANDKYYVSTYEQFKPESPKRSELFDDYKTAYTRALYEMNNMSKSVEKIREIIKILSNKGYSYSDIEIFIPRIIDNNNDLDAAIEQAKQYVTRRKR